MSKKITLDLWKQFTNEELQQMGGELSEEVASLETVEAQKKTVADEFKTKIEGIEGRISTLAARIRAKGANFPTDCEVRYHTPRTGFRQIIRLDTGELVREEGMTPQECQENLFATREIEELERMAKEPPPDEKKNK